MRNRAKKEEEDTAIPSAEGREANRCVCFMFSAHFMSKARACMPLLV